MGVIQALGVLQPADQAVHAAAVISRLQQDPHQEVRRVAAVALGTMGPIVADIAGGVLADRARSDENDAVRKASVVALLALTPSRPGISGSMPCVEADDWGDEELGDD